MRNPKEHEPVVIKAAERVVQLVEEGQDPTDALVTASKEAQLLPNTVRLLGRMVNTGQQEYQRKSSQDSLTKFAAFPLVDPEAAVERIWSKPPVEKKAALVEGVCLDYLAPPTNRQAETEKKAAAVLNTFVKSASPSPETMRTKFADLLNRAVDSKAGFESELDHWYAKEMHLHGLINKAASYFRVAREYRKLDFAEVDHNVCSRLGAVGRHLMDCVAEKLASVKRAGAEIPLRPCHFEQEPYATISLAVKAAEDLASQRPKVLRAAQRVKEACELLDARRGREQPLEKNASIWGGMLGGSINAQLSGALTPKTPGQKVEDMLGEFESPEHASELRRIQAQAMLHDLMANDEVLSEYPPEKVLGGFNELSQLAPRVAGKPPIVRSLLRRHLQSNVQPFEMRETVDMERGLRDTSEPTLRGEMPGANILKPAG